MDVHLRGNGARGGAEFLRHRFEEEHTHDEDRQPLNQPEHEERAPVAAGLNHACERDHGCGRAQTITHRDQPRRQTPAVRKPFERRPHAGTEDTPHTDAADDRARIKTAQRLRVRIHDPRNGSTESAEHHHEPRSVAIYQQPFERREPGVEQDHDAERQLNAGPLPVVLLLHRIDEKCPAVLHVREHDGAGHHQG